MGLFDKIKKSFVEANEFAKAEALEKEKKEKESLHIDYFDELLEQEKIAYQTFKEKCIEEYNRSFYVDKAFDNLKKKHGVELFDRIPEDLKKEKYYKQKISEFMNYNLRLCSKAFKEKRGTVAFLYKMVNELAYFDELKEMADSLLVHNEYFSSSEKAARSVLNTEEPINVQFENILNMDRDNALHTFLTMNDVIDAAIKDKVIEGRKISEDEADYLITSHAMFSCYDENFINNIKKLNLYSALVDERDRENIGVYELINYTSMFAFGFAESDGKEVFMIPGVDLVIADAIRSAKNGTVEKFNERFNAWLNSHGNIIDADQLTIFQNVFQEIKAYSSEMILLNYIFEEEIEHTAEQEKRLNFLKENKSIISKSSIKYEPVYTENGTETDGKVFIYDQRPINWSTSEIEEYFKRLILSNEKQKISIVVDRWSNNVKLESKKWDNKTIHKLITDVIKREYDEDYDVIAVDSGVVIDGENDVTASVLIKPTEDARYSDLAYLVVGEPMTKYQVSVSILSLVIIDSYQNTDSLCKRIISIKDNHNPKLATYIDTIKNIIIDELNRWVVYMNGIDDIY